MRRTCLFLGLIAACLLTGLLVWRASRQHAGAAPPGPERAGRPLPLTWVVLFNTGLGYFFREGEVEGDARVDLTFPAGEVNDLVRSLVLHDGGRMGLVSYDSPESLEKALKSFALDLTYNPTYGQILNQVRGEKVEVTTSGGGAGPTLTGKIVGMEQSGEEAGRETHLLNLQTSDGLRRVPLGQVQHVRFLDPVLEEDFNRALTVLAGTHNNARRTVQVHFPGEGKRAVKLGYVVEAPVWKPNYRLLLKRKDRASALHGWAVVENTSDEDWRDVRIALVAGRPLSFQMGLTQPLFLPRPTVEPRAYASLRPPEHAAALPQLGGQIGSQVGGVQVGGLGVSGERVPGPMDGLGAGLSGGSARGFNRYQDGPGAPLGPPPAPTTTPKLTYEELQERRAAFLEKKKQEREQAKQIGTTLTESDERLDEVVANADNLGDTFSYTVEQKVTLPRHRSALVPLFQSALESRQLSVFNKQVHPRFPLRAVRLKNTTGQNVVQGPVAVYEEIYAGDTQVPDLQPGAERLVSYAMDLGLEVRDQRDERFDPVTRLRLARGVLTTAVARRAATFYHLRNRAAQDRDLLVEHPITDGWAYRGPEKPVEQTDKLQRFEWRVPAGKSLTREVLEEQEQADSKRLADLQDATLKTLLASAQASKGVQEALRGALERRARVAVLLAELADANDLLKVNEREQERLRDTIARVPKDTPVQKRYLETLAEAEKAFEKLSRAVREKQEAEKKERAGLEEFQKTATAE